MNADNHDDTLDRAREVSEVERARVVLLPRGEVEVGQGRDLRGDRPPGATQTECSTGENASKLRLQGR
jgi:hypothetical protein